MKMHSTQGAHSAEQVGVGHFGRRAFLKDVGSRHFCPAQYVCRHWPSQSAYLSEGRSLKPQAETSRGKPASVSGTSCFCSGRHNTGCTLPKRLAASLMGRVGQNSNCLMKDCQLVRAFVLGLAEIFSAPTGFDHGTTVYCRMWYKTQARCFSTETMQKLSSA